MNNISLGIDIGGTNTDFGLITKEGKCLRKGRVKTTEFTTPNDLAKAIFEHVNVMLTELSEKHSIIGVGIGAPNGNYFNGTIEFAPNLKWKGVINLIKTFTPYFNCPIYVTNDANAAAMGEMTFGNAKGSDNFMLITLGTGLGSAFVANGQMIYGHDGFAGELGHTIIVENGRDCGCGRKGCLETYVSSTGVVRTAKIILAQSSERSLLRDIDGNKLETKDIAAAAMSGDQLARSIFDYTAKKLGFSLANTIAITSPEKIILSGGLAQAKNLLIQPTYDYMEEYLHNIYKGKVSLEFSSIVGNNSGVLGAGALVWNEINDNKFKNIETN